MLIVNNDSLSCSGLLLDFDGTLVDSEPMLVSLWIDLCKERGKLVDSNLMGELIHGRPATMVVQDLFPDIGETETNRFLKDLESKEEVAPYNLMDGACEFIRSAHEKSISLGIVTTSWPAKVWNVLDRFKIGHLFSVIVTREDVSKLKPDPEPYLVAEKRIGINRSNLVAFEDSWTGIVSAKAAGMRCIGFGQESLREFGVDFVVPAFSCIKFGASYRGSNM